MNKLFDAVAWGDGANIYEVNIRQYTKEGTFSAFAEHLPRLKDMGVEILWLMPITPIGVEKRLGSLGSYYACKSYVQVNPEFGSLDDLKALVKQAHDLGFKLIIDWVANHTGYDHEWVEGGHTDWYVLDEAGNFTEKYGWNDVIDLNYNNNHMREAMINAMQFWINECDIDGFRCDMAHLVPLDFWVEARKRCDKVKHLFWLAECEVPAYHEVFDVSYAWQFMHVTEKFMQQHALLNDVIHVLEQYAHYPAGAKKLFFTSNHDENSWNGTEYEKYREAAKAFAVFTCTWPGMPLVYSGQEMANKKRLKFFEKDALEWTPTPLLHDFYKTLLHLRRNNSALQNESRLVKLPTNVNEQVLAYLQVHDNQKVLIIINFSGSGRLKVEMQHTDLPGKYYNAFTGIAHQLEFDASFELQPWEFIVWTTS
ncbi:Glycosidase [Filimonas lacunae]|uniref:Glycosidase n=1 Tax=Filimonas lacunae TaxID=477680 RepID=A0A173MLK1_9BACT|nr:alpha-amylase family glycosyl hydrolase [Filimonas lacunae]BAV08281.1 1,4-alpha-glucan branching enzyme [Filimonas lacunae]SIT33239.1 Glycosidase [Filimonas lacunae]